MRKKLVLFAFLVFASFPIAAKAPTTQDMLSQWTAIERRLNEWAGHEALLGDLELLEAQVKAFQKSDMHRIFRLIPLSGKFENTDIAFLLEVFREAITQGDREGALLLSAEISADLAHWQAWGGDVEIFANAAYFRLLVVFLAFIVLCAFAVHVLGKTLVRSLYRDAEGSGFSQAFLLAQEKERERISRELHDTVAQDLRWLSLGMGKISRTEEAGERERLCDEAAAAQSGLIRRLRDICDYLVPPDFRFQGLKDAIRRLCLDFEKRSGIECHAEIMEGLNLDFLNEEKQLQVFRIIQEALANVEKHACAQKAIVILRADSNGDIYIGISDDGKGFVYPLPSDGTHKQQLGIRGMEKRAALIGGKFKINSDRGEGTMVCLVLDAPPVKESDVSTLN